MAGPVETSRHRDKGDEALAAGLWEVAEMHFRQSLADAIARRPRQNHKSLIRLAESLIRAGNPAEALEIAGPVVRREKSGNAVLESPGAGRPKPLHGGSRNFLRPA